MDNLEDVEDLTSLWNFDEESIDDLKMRLQCATNDLAEARREAMEQAKINKQNIKKLIHLIGIAYGERDEAKDQMRNLLMVKPHTPTTTIMTTSDMDKSGLTSGKTALPTKQPPGNNLAWILRSSEATTLPTMSPRSPLMMANNIANIHVTNANSGMTSHSNTPSSSLDSYFDVGTSSPEFYNMGSDNFGSSNYARPSSCDPTSTMLHNLATGRPRPDKGNFLQSVMEAGPLLDSLLVAGTLPEWMNPPQAVHAPQVPPVPISMCKRPHTMTVWKARTF